MAGTAPDPPPSAEEHAYFLAIESTFLRLRGKAMLLSSSDWQIAQGWFRSGISLEVVLPVMEQLFERARERKGRPISALRYFRAAVAAAWEEVESLSAGSRRERLEPLRVEERLARLAAALPPDLPQRPDWASRVVALDGSVDLVESGLSELDRDILQVVDASLSAAEREPLRLQVEEALARLRARLPAAELERSKSHLEAQLLRRHARLPLLSLFSPEARGTVKTES